MSDKKKYTIKLTDEEVKALRKSEVNGPLYHLLAQIQEQVDNPYNLSDEEFTKVYEQAKKPKKTPSETVVCQKCGGYGGEHQSPSPFQSYLPCYACGL